MPEVLWNRIDVRGGECQRAHGADPFASERAWRTSFQSPPSSGGRSRANGTLSVSASDR